MVVSTRSCVCLCLRSHDSKIFGVTIVIFTGDLQVMSLDEIASGNLLPPEAPSIDLEPPTGYSWRVIPTLCLPYSNVLGILPVSSLPIDVLGCPSISSTNHSWSSGAPKSYGSSWVLSGKATSLLAW